MKRITSLIKLVVVIVIFGGALWIVHSINLSNQKLHIKKIELQNTEKQLKVLEDDYNKLNTNKVQSDKQIQELEQKKQELEKALQAKALIKAQQVAYAASLPSAYEAKMYIYMHESGNNLQAVNSIGACGLGQSLPCSKMSSVCPDWRTNYACQDAWFTAYMTSRYGTWIKAYEFWVANRYW